MISDEGESTIDRMGKADVGDVADERDAEIRTSMYQTQTKTWTLCMIVGWVMNLGLLLVSHIGINAIVLSSKDVGEPGSFVPSTPGSDNCNASDVNVWEGTNVTALPSITPSQRCDVWDSLSSFTSGRPCPYGDKTAAKFAHNDYMFAYGACANTDFFPCNAGQDYGSLPDNEQVMKMVETEWGFSSSCSSCFADQVTCTVSLCAAQCTSSLSLKGCPNPTNSECVECVQEKCVTAFAECTGFDMVPLDEYNYTNCAAVDFGDIGGSASNAAGECTSKEVLDDTTFFEVFIIRFSNGVYEAWKGGAKFLAILIAVASGAWPYIKNIVMVTCWFVPMTPARRESLIAFLARFGRWSLVDVFAVILIIVGLRIDKEIVEGSALIIRASSEYAIYCFALAALWALGQGEFISWLNRKEQRANPNRHANKRGAGDMSAGKKSAIRFSFFAVSFLALSLLFVGLAMSNIKFQMSGIVDQFDGPNVFEYTGFGVALALVDECQVDPLGEYYLVAVFLVTVIAMPLVALCGYMWISAQPEEAMANRKGIVRFINICGNFSSVDVYILSLLVLVSQFEPLIDGSIGQKSEELCGVGVSSKDCIAFKGTLELGVIITSIAAVLIWIAQFLAVYVQNHYRQLTMASDLTAEVKPTGADWS